jgi:glycosyltransferase involved in cell wall biosynthesis
MATPISLGDDAISAHILGGEKDFLAEMNPGGIFSEVLLLNWKEGARTEFAGIASVPFLDSQEDRMEAYSLMYRLSKCEIEFAAPLFAPIFERALGRITQIVRDFEPDVIRAFNTHFAAELGIMAKKCADVPLMISAHDPSRLTTAMTEANLLACESEELKSLCIGAFNFPQEHIRVVPSGIDLELFRPRDHRALGRYIPPNLKDAPFKILSISRLVPGKNIEILLQALSLIRADFPGLAHLHIGRAEEESMSRYLDLRDRTGLRGCSHLLPPMRKADLPYFYSWADVFVLPTLWEGLSRVMREALACGTPVVATNYGSTLEIVENEHNGLLIDPLNAHSIASALARLLGDRGLRSRLASNAVGSVRRYGAEGSMRLFKEAYEHLLAEFSPSREHARKAWRSREKE